MEDLNNPVDPYKQDIDDLVPMKKKPGPNTPEGRAKLSAIFKKVNAEKVKNNAPEQFGYDMEYTSRMSALGLIARKQNKQIKEMKNHMKDE